MLAQLVNQQPIADINICRWLQYYEEQLADPSKFTIIELYRGNSTTQKTSWVAGNTQLLHHTVNFMAHIARTLCHTSNIKCVFVEVYINIEDLDKAPCKRTFQTFLQLRTENR